MDESLITKYRPKSFKEVVGQAAAVKSLQGVLAKKNVRAYLFLGPSGCGKTTLARIVASEVGCRPEDVQEVDAATYTGIDAMREVTRGLQYKPLGEGAVKVIIIDECHALSKQSWQALLKILEEPPSWVYWFLCTTEATRVPATINTRCAKYELKPVAKDKLFDLLVKVADEERFKCTDEVLNLCAKEANGSPRQALSNLAVCADVKDRREAAELLKAAGESSEAIDLARELMSANTNWKQISLILDSLREQNPESVRHVVRTYITKAVLGTANDKAVIRGLEILDAFSEPFNSGDGVTPLVLAAGKAMFR